MKKILLKMKKMLAATTLMAFVVSSLGLQSITVANAAVAANWDTTGSYVVNMNYLGSDYAHDMALTQDGAGNLTGNGGSPAGANVYTWAITSGTVSGDTIDFNANYTATADAVTPQTVLHVVGTITSGGAMSGTWSDNYQGGDRSGTWVSTSGTATLVGTLAAEDFGVVDYDTGLGQLRGYSAGFGLTNATFENAQSVVVQLFNGATLLQTNTGTPKIGTDITGNQISSPFDVSGSFDYATDGYWTNAREAQFGQSTPATRVVATVTLANGKVVTAENTNLSGDPTTIYPVASGTVVVTINKFVNGVQATASSSNSLDFPMSATYNATNTGAGTGTYALSAAGYNGDPTPYQAKTIPLTSGADYATNEIVGGAVVGTTCATSSAPFAFVGYSTGNSLAEAMIAAQSTSTPTLTNITSDKYVIVWNKSCATSGTIGGTVTGGQGSGVGTLAVTGITAVKTTAVADGTFASGWKYTFSITVPTNETNLSMKFADWASDVGSNTLPAANNMRISSTQADNAGATVLVTAANTYTVPTLNMTGDLNPLLDGKQVEVSVEVAVPSSTVNGSYTTSYGVKTQ